MNDNQLVDIFKEDFNWWYKSSFDSSFWSILLKEAQPVYLHHEHVIDIFVKASWTITFEGFKAAVTNAPYPFTSNACDKLLKRYPDVDIAISIVLNEGDAQTWSLRSRVSSDIDVSLLALKHGGGGHFHASGFKKEK